MSEPEAAQEPTMEEILASIRRIISEDESARENVEASSDDAPEEFTEQAAAYEPPADEPVDEVSAETPDEGVAEMPEEAPVRETYAAYETPEATERAWGDERETSNPNEEQYASVTQVFGADDDTEYEAFDEDDTVVEFEPESHDVQFEAADESELTSFESDEVSDEAAFSPEPAYVEPESETVHVAHQDESFQAAAREAVEEQVLSPDTEAQVASLMGQLSQAGDAANEDNDPAISVEEVVRDMVRPMLQAWLDDNLPTLVEQIVEREIKRVMRAR